MSAHVNGPSKHRPTSSTWLTLAQLVGLFAAVAAGVAVGLGIYPDVATSPPMGWLIPFIVAAVLAFGLGAGWHVVMSMAADAREPSSKITTFVLALVLTVIGVGCSAWFLAAKLGGATAIQTYQTTHLGALRDAEAVASANASAESEIIAAMASGASSLETLARDEGLTGRVSKTGRGERQFYGALSAAATAFDKAQTAIANKHKERGDLLADARLDIEDAGRAIAARNHQAFETASNRAATAIAKADRIKLSAMLSGLAVGLDVGQARAPIENAIGRVTEIARAVDARRYALKVPVYYAIDAKEAVIIHAAPLPWLASILIETLSLLMTVLLLMLRRDPEPDDQNAVAVQTNVVGLDQRPASLRPVIHPAE